MLDDPFGIKVVVGGAVELAKARWLPVLAASGEARAELIRLRGEFEVRKLENKLRVFEIAEDKLRGRGIAPNPVNEDVLFNILEEASKVSNDVLHQMWAELLALSSAGQLENHKTLTFVRLVSQLTPSDVTAIGILLDLIPSGDDPISSVNYKIAVSTSEDHCSSCECNFGVMRASLIRRLSESVTFASDEEFDEFIFSIRNMERLGIISNPRIDSMVLGVKVTQYFVFTRIGIEFLCAVDALGGRRIQYKEFDLF